MKCPNCIKDNPEEALFCQNCGQPIALVCTNCGTTNAPDAKFCMKCGTRLDVLSDPESETMLKSLQKSAPLVLKEKMREAGAELEGERKPVTILFTDIVGSTAMAEKLDPEVWKKIVAGAHMHVGKAVYRYEGTIAQLLGDGVLAYFGAPLTHEDDPIRAVRAAMDIQESIKTYDQELADIVDDLQVRIGINTGTMVIGEVGTDMHMEYLAIGDAVNVAARLQSEAEPGKVVLSEECARLVRPEFDLKDLGQITIKGKEDPLQVFELVGVKTAPETGRGIEGLPTHYVGRAQELEELTSALLALCNGHGQIVTVMGEAGIGKTRLLEEVKTIICEDEGDLETTAISPSSIRWLEGRALSYGGSLSYWTITQLLLADLGLSDGSPLVEIKVTLRKRVRVLFGEEKSEEVMPSLAYLLGLKVEGEVEELNQSLEGEKLKKRTLQSLVDYFTHVAEEGPTVLVFEDMHWADPSSLEALAGFLALTDRVPLMILMLMRIERDHGSWEVKHKAETDFPHRTKEIHLRRLSEGDSSSLLEQLLGATHLPKEIEHTIMERAEGNPFYLEEVVRHLMEQELIIQDEEGWYSTEALEEIGIPDTLQGVLLARIDRLEEDVRHTLQMASVIGKSFLYRILEAVAEAEVQLDTHLSQLQRIDLVREKARIPELEYMFKHALTQEAAYNSLLYERRKVFHLKVGEALEELFPDRGDEFSGLMAYHYEKAEAHEKAVDYLQRAGDRTRIAYAHQEAVDYYERALVILKQQEAYDRAARTLMKLGLTHHIAFDFKRSRQAYDEAFAMRQHEWATKQEPLEPAPHPLRLVNQEPLTLDASLHTDVSSSEYIIGMSSMLVKMGSGGEIIPDVAQDWEISEDGCRYVFHLRDDIFWSDGTQTKAEDFVCRWMRTLDPRTKAPMGKATQLYDIKNAKAYHQGEISDPEQVGLRAIDKLTLEVELEKPTSYFLHQMIQVPIPKHMVEIHGESWADWEKIVTNGPFQLETFQRGKGVTLVRNPNYHGQFLGNLEKVQITFLELAELRYEMYKAGRIDVVELRPETFKMRHQHAGEYVSVPLPASFFLVFDTRQPPFDDILVRRAFANALDKEKLADEVFDGLWYPATGGHVPPAIPGHSPGISLPYDPSQARSLLAQAGYPRGRGLPEITFGFYGNPKTNHYLRTQWLDHLNIEVTLVPIEREIYFSEEHGTNISLRGSLASYPDPIEPLRVTVRSYLPYWQNETYEQLLEEARITLDQSDRIRLCQDADKLLIEEAVVIPIAYVQWHYLVKPWVKLPPGGIGPDSLECWKDMIIESH